MRLLVTLMLPALSLGASAQDLFFEDFEAGVIPPAWQILGTAPLQWGITAPGECGSVSNMVHYGFGAPTCGYFTGSFNTYGVLQTPGFTITGNGSHRFEMSYILEANVGDQASVTIQEDAPFSDPLAVLDINGLINDGNLHTVSVETPTLITGSSMRLSFHFSADPPGSARGFFFDNVRLFDDTPGSSYCFGDGGNCPCGNSAGAGEGCANSTGSGGVLDANGVASVSADTVVLSVTGLPATAPGLYFQGTTQENGGAGVAFGDGLRCVGGSLIRLGTEASVGGASSHPGIGDPSVSVKGMITPADTRQYQVWYRNNAGPCGFGFNLTGAVEISWAP